MTTARHAVTALPLRRPDLDDPAPVDRRVLVLGGVTAWLVLAVVGYLLVR